MQLRISQLNFVLQIKNLGSVVTKEVDSVEANYLENESIFHIHLNETQVTEDCQHASLSPTITTTVCRKPLYFIWLPSGQEICQARFLCDGINGNFCGDFGIFLTHSGQNFPYCFPRSTLSQGLNPGDTMEISVWKVKEAHLNISCYLWCVEKENDKVKRSTDDANEFANNQAEIIDQMVRAPLFSLLTTIQYYLLIILFSFLDEVCRQS